MALAVIAIISSVTVAALVASGAIRPPGLNILPMAEGLNMGVYGFSPAGSEQCYSTAQDLPGNYSWISRDPQNSIVQKAIAGWPPPTGQVAAELSVTHHDDPVQSIKYYVKVSEDASTITYKEVVGQLVPYYVTLDVFTPPRSGPAAFQGEKIWLTALTVKWDRAISDPDDPSKSVWGTYSIPLAVFVDDYELLGFRDYLGNMIQPDPAMQASAQLSPSLRGRWFTLYSEPSTVASLSDLYQNPATVAATLNQSLAGNPTPDTRFRTQVYFPITLSNYGTYSSWNWWRLANDEFYPSTEYTLKVLYLQLGEFTFTVDKQLYNSTIPKWEDRNSTQVVQPGIFDGVSAWWQAFTGWFANPLNLAGVFILLGITVIVIVVIFLSTTSVGRAIDKRAGKAVKNAGRNGGKRK